MDNKIKITILLILTGLSAVAVQAQRPGKEKHLQVREYIETNILPTAVEYRNDFESMLTEEEKVAVNGLRERQQAINEEVEKMRKQRGLPEDGGFRRGERPTFSEEEKSQMRMIRKEMRLIATEAFEIVDAHDDFFVAMEHDLATDREQWDKDIRSLLDRNKQGRGQEGKRRRVRYRPSFGGHGLRGGSSEILAPVTFVLMDPDNPRFGPEEAEGANIFPNPANGTQTIALDLEKAGNVQVELINQEGKVERVLYNGRLSQGKQAIEVDLSGFQGKQYVYRITTPSGSEMKRVLLKD